MKAHSLEQVNIMIIDYDVFFNNLIAKKFKNFQQRTDITNKFKLNIKQFNQKDVHVLKKEEEKNSIKSSIAFIDYTLANGKNGQRLINVLLKTYNNIKIIFMSHQEEPISKNNPQDFKKIGYARIFKNQFTPDICSIIVENYIKNL